MNAIKIYCKNDESEKEIPVSSPIKDILSVCHPTTRYPVLAAKVNNITKDLNYQLYKPCDIEFLDYSSPTGMRVYVRSLAFILSAAIKELFPKTKLRIEFPISNGYFCWLSNQDILTQENTALIKKKMTDMIRSDIPFGSYMVKRETGIELFRKEEMEDKVLLMQTTRFPYITYQQLGSYIDYYYNVLVPSTGYITLFDLHLYNDGLFLQVPLKDNPYQLAPFHQSSLLYDVYRRNLKLQHLVQLNNIGDLNYAIDNKIAGDLIKVAEALHEKRISQIADQIAAKDKVRVILISGPSSSGKTTFSKRLGIQLFALGIRPEVISLDNYYVDREKTPKDESGEYDYESLYALDLELFNKDLKRIINGEEVNLPTYNFVVGKREYNGNTLQLSPNSVLIMEGIHALNPNLTPKIDQELKFGIYVSALTTISIDDHNWIPTTDNRLLRRIIRDHKYRNYSAEESILKWPSVRSGEEKWIFPYQENADLMFNSALIFELAVIKNQAYPLLQEVPRDSIAYSEAYRLSLFLEFIRPLQENEIPPTSLLREFLGGSSFTY